MRVTTGENEKKEKGNFSKDPRRRKIRGTSRLIVRQVGNRESLKIVTALPLPLPITSLTYPLNSLAPTLIFTSTRLAVLSLGSSYSHDIQYPTVTRSWPSYPPILYLLPPRSILIVPSFVSPLAHCAGKEIVKSASQHQNWITCLERANPHVSNCLPAPFRVTSRY